MCGVSEEGLHGLVNNSMNKKNDLGSIFYINNVMMQNTNCLIQTPES